MDPKITILVPSYNHSLYLKQRIDTIYAQTYNNYEVIVIDDCSNDDSESLINDLLNTYCFTYIKNIANSGSPFASWETIVSIARGDYIWICESDDYADPDFLRSAVKAITSVADAVIAYCDSWIIDENSYIIDHSDTYFHDVWRESRWDHSFVVDGSTELTNFQLRGQTVPNMSSMLISSDAYRKAFRPFIKSFKLTGDWLFVGLLMKYGRVVYFKETLNYFRKHNNTARVRVESARSQAEFMLTKYSLFRETNKSINAFAAVISSDAVRFYFEEGRFYDIIIMMMKISVDLTLRFSLSLILTLMMNPKYLNGVYRYLQRYKWGEIKK